MNRNVTTAFISLLFAFAFGWGIGSYVAWNVNPGTWTDGGRLIDAVIIAVACVLTFLGLRWTGRRDRAPARATATDEKPR